MHCGPNNLKPKILSEKSEDVTAIFLYFSYVGNIILYFDESITNISLQNTLPVSSFREWTRK